MDRIQFDKLRAYTVKKLEITKDNLGDKSIEITNLFARYYDQFIDEYKIYKDLLTDKDKMYGELYNKNRYDSKLESRTKNEIEPFIHSNEEYYQLCLRLNEQEMIVKYLEGICEAIKKLSYNIKNVIDLKNLGMQA